MTTQQIISVLIDRFGKEKVLIRSEYHLQIFIKVNEFHNIWVNSRGEIKWKCFGNQKTKEGNIKKMLSDLGSYTSEKTDLAEMQTAVALSHSVVAAGKIAKANNIHRGIFCDAGFKEGNSRISVIAILDEEVSAFSRPVIARNVQEAEKMAIDFAMIRFPDHDIPIFSDNQTAVREINSKRVAWISRDLNQNADRIANLRGN